MVRTIPTCRPRNSCIAICLFVSARTFRPWTHTSDDSYIYKLSLVVATATVSLYFTFFAYLVFVWCVVHMHLTCVPNVIYRYYVLTVCCILCLHLVCVSCLCTLCVYVACARYIRTKYLIKCTLRTYLFCILCVPYLCTLCCTRYVIFLTPCVRLYVYLVCALCLPCAYLILYVYLI